MSDFLNGLTLETDIVNSLKNNKVINLTKPYLEFGIRKYKEKNDIQDKDIFTYVGNCLYIHLENGDIIGFETNNVKDSILVWFAYKEGIQQGSNEDMEKIPYDHPIYGNRERWAGLINEQIKNIRVFTRKTPEGMKSFVDSNEKAILLELTNCSLLLPYGGRFEYRTVMPILKLEEAPNGYFEGMQVIEL